MVRAEIRGKGCDNLELGHPASQARTLLSTFTPITDAHSPLLGR